MAQQFAPGQALAQAQQMQRHAPGQVPPQAVPAQLQQPNAAAYYQNQQYAACSAQYQFWYAQQAAAQAQQAHQAQQAALAANTSSSTLGSGLGAAGFGYTPAAYAPGYAQTMSQP